MFTSGIIFSPMVLLGIISGICCIIQMEPEKIRLLFLDARFYTGVVVVSAIYAIVFAKVYREGGNEVDWTATFMKAVWGIVRYLVAFVLSMSFVMMISIF